MSERQLLQLSTSVVPATIFTVDDDEFKILGLEHLSEDEEASIMGLFSQYGQLNDKLAAVKRRDDAEMVARKLRRLRLELLVRMTDLPAAVAEKLPLSQQLLLIEAVTNELNTPPPAARASTDADDDEAPDPELIGLLQEEESDA